MKEISRLGICGMSKRKGEVIITLWWVTEISDFNWRIEQLGQILRPLLRLTGTLSQLLPSNGIPPRTQYSRPQGPMTKLRSGILPLSKTTKRQVRWMIHRKAGGRCRLNSCSYIKVRRTSRRSIGILRYQALSFRQRSTDSTSSKRYRSNTVACLLKVSVYHDVVAVVHVS